MAKKALLVGLNSYPDPANNLRGCLNDVRAVRAVLQERYGFQAGRDVRLLTDGAATTRAIVAGLRWLVAGARNGDVLVFHYSGHGSQVVDRNGDERTDGLDEIICPYDLDWRRPLTDDDLHEIVKGVPAGANLTVVLDCCHAGTGLREGTGAARPTLPIERSPRRFRYLDPPTTSDAAPASTAPCQWTEQGFGPARRPVRRFGRAAVDSGGLLVAACRDDQVSADAFIHGDYHGALTYYLCEALAASSFSTTYEALVREVRRLLRLNGFDQVPQLEGPAEARRQLAFVAARSPVLA